jgi:hypothetical protein
VNRYRKFIAAFLLAVVSALVAVGADGIDSPEMINALVAGIGAVFVLITDPSPALKALAAALSTGLVALSAALSDGVTSAEWYQIAFAAIAVATSYFVSNKPESGQTRAQSRESSPYA